FFSSRRRHTRSKRDWSSDVCSSDLGCVVEGHERTVGGRVHVRLQVGVAEVDGVLEGDCCVFQFGAAHALIVDEPAAPVSQCHGAGGGKVHVSHIMQYAVF